jgi:hypothetical protein
MLASERVWLDGTVQRDREHSLIQQAVWNTCHDPEVFGFHPGDW